VKGIYEKISQETSAVGNTSGSFTELSSIDIKFVSAAQKEHIINFLRIVTTDLLSLLGYYKRVLFSRYLCTGDCILVDVGSVLGVILSTKIMVIFPKMQKICDKFRDYKHLKGCSQE
jgi:hypothetical protein